MDNRDEFSRALSDAFTGAYKMRRLTQEVVAERADMSPWTLQKKLKGRAPITATDLVVLSRAIGVSPGDMIHAAEKLLAERQAKSEPMSVVRPTLKPLPHHDEVETDEEHDAAMEAAYELLGEGEEYQTPRAANFDPEHEQDEPAHT